MNKAKGGQIYNTCCVRGSNVKTGIRVEKGKDSVDLWAIGHFAFSIANEHGVEIRHDME